jgi:hypothetical protein
LVPYWVRLIQVVAMVPAKYHSVDTVGPILGQVDTGSGNGPAIYHNVDTVPYWVKLIVAMVLQYITM